ncbi:serine protease [Kribbella sp. ALI-6-A]|uniref:S1 family peptidase n=1 Tax=Kribbella sp. ALI-6-A TaxID=1933817 RepID=UPI00097CA7CE|nr:serine protease [Kribbella sp. ALI-6-A]ONI77632.1 serine protease [Kribbella sp. ALI-6-A]
MAEQGRSELPRPPRRIPSWAVEHDDARAPSGPRTTIEPRRRTPGESSGATRYDGPGALPPKFRLRFVWPLVVFVLVLGAAAGWLVRADRLSLDTDEVMDKAGPAVVQVLATTCAGTGQATGVLLPGGVVLTAASAIREPISAAVVTQDGKVRRVEVRGVNANGIAVLGMPGWAGLPTATLAHELPEPAAERGLVGHRLDGEQVSLPIGTTQQPRELSEIDDTGLLGAPLVDKHGRVIGLLTGETMAGSRIISLDELRDFAGGSPPLTPEPIGACRNARGPQSPVEPELAVANTPLAGEVRQALAEYLQTLNKHDFAAMQATYSSRLRARSDPAEDAKKHGTSYAFRPVIESVASAGPDNDADALLSFTVLFSPDSAGANRKTCGRLKIRYHLVREQQRLRIDSAFTAENKSGCDTD